MRAAAVALVVLATPAVAADCPLSRATYGQAETGFTLQFRPLTPEDGLTTSNVFEMLVPNSDQRVPGNVMWGNGFSRPIGRLTFDCPAEPSIEDEEFCTRWRGIVYGVSAGTIGLLPEEETAPAPEQLILANLGQSIRYSGLIEALMVEIPDPPWDVFQFKGCAP